MEQRFETLTGLRILVVEDETMIAMMLEVMLEDFGCRVVGLAPSLEKALAAIRQPALDGVLLDMNMHGKSTDAVAKELLGRAVPFLLVTGYDDRETDPTAISTAPRLKKPFSQEELAQRMVEVFGTPSERVSRSPLDGGNGP